jgi:hypothetical protein
MRKGLPVAPGIRRRAAGGGGLGRRPVRAAPSALASVVVRVTRIEPAPGAPIRPPPARRQGQAAPYRRYARRVAGGGSLSHRLGTAVLEARVYPLMPWTLVFTRRDTGQPMASKCLPHHRNPHPHACLGCSIAAVSPQRMPCCHPQPRAASRSPGSRLHCTDEDGFVNRAIKEQSN